VTVQVRPTAAAPPTKEASMIPRIICKLYGHLWLIPLAYKEQRQLKLCERCHRWDDLTIDDDHRVMRKG
jgi:hypothetical protein